MTAHRPMSRPVIAWVRPLKDGATQYYASCPEGYIYGAARSNWGAHDLICDFLYGEGHTEDWELEVKPALGKWDG